MNTLKTAMAEVEKAEKKAAEIEAQIAEGMIDEIEMFNADPDEDGEEQAVYHPPVDAEHPRQSTPAQVTGIDGHQLAELALAQTSTLVQQLEDKQSALIADKADLIAKADRIDGELMALREALARLKGVS